MAHVDLGHSNIKMVSLPGAPGQAVHRTQYMLAITSIASVIILVVAALFISLF
jgi:hypothetical protein